MGPTGTVPVRTTPPAVVIPEPPEPPVPSDLSAGGAETCRSGMSRKRPRSVASMSMRPDEVIDGERLHGAVDEVGQRRGDTQEVGLDGHLAHDVALYSLGADLDVLVLSVPRPG